MSVFSSVAQSLGNVGSDVAVARQNVKDIDQNDAMNAFTNKLNALKLQQLQQSLGTQADPLQAKIASVEKVLGRPLTATEKESLAGLLKADATPPANTPFEVWRAANPTSSVADWLKLQQDAKPKPAAPTDKTPFEEWRTQNPTAPVADWLKLQSSNRRQPEGTGPEARFDPSINAAAAGQINPPSPTTKMGAAWWSRAESLGVADSIRTRSFANGRQSADPVIAAQKAYDAELDKYNKWKADHYVIGNLGIGNPYEATLSDKLDKLNAAKAGGGSDANFGGTPVSNAR